MRVTELNSRSTQTSYYKKCRSAKFFKIYLFLKIIIKKYSATWSTSKTTFVTRRNVRIHFCICVLRTFQLVLWSGEWHDKWLGPVGIGLTFQSKFAFGSGIYWLSSQSLYHVSAKCHYFLETNFKFSRKKCLFQNNLECLWKLTFSVRAAFWFLVGWKQKQADCPPSFSTFSLAYSPVS